MNEERIPLVVMGRRLGTYTGWDQQDTLVFTYYDFISEVTTQPVPDGTFTLNYETGEYEVWLDDVEVGKGFLTF